MLCLFVFCWPTLWWVILNHHQFYFGVLFFLVPIIKTICVAGEATRRTLGLWKKKYVRYIYIYISIFHTYNVWDTIDHLLICFPSGGHTIYKFRSSSVGPPRHPSPNYSQRTPTLVWGVCPVQWRLGSIVDCCEHTTPGWTPSSWCVQADEQGRTLFE